MDIIRKCPECGQYTLLDICPRCGAKTINAHPEYYNSDSNERGSMAGKA